ncbi:MAG: methyltetrahydrofolate cobalamin methyltransferase [Desulfobacteraceae bacterium]|nr:MAG: methyltetrahydrofolate cobalamin methyltransferase [Desulfobacteraceae bacterium]
MIIIGEKINSSRRQIAEAIASGNREYIQNEAIVQSDAGADYIDVNAAAFMEKEAEYLRWIIEAVQEVIELPLCIDSPDPKVIGKVISLVKKPPMINSITLESSRLDGILPFVLDYRATVIGLCQTGNRMGKSAAEKVEIAGRLIEKVTSTGIGINTLFIDPLVFPVGADSNSACATLDAIEEIMKHYQGVHTVCGLTNVSHGLPNRKLVNRTFLAEAVARGLDAAILDPSDKQLLGTLRAALMLMGKDEYCMGYIKAFRKGLLA